MGSQPGRSDQLSDRGDLPIEFLHEFLFALRATFPTMVQGEDGYWRFRRAHNMIPLLFSLKASKPV
ncbi:MAG TPA: hypothetical protein VFS61_10475 [Anaerolineales bacterium]|nr:hypothetical protein [Anaerolineales bacterium]